MQRFITLRRFRQAATVCLGREKRSMQRPTIAFKFNTIPRSADTFFSLVQELATANRPLHLCLPTDASYRDKLTVVRRVYRLCAEQRIPDVYVLLYEPLHTCAVRIPHDDPRGRDADRTPVTRFEWTVLGGTFDRLHYGHKLLLAEAALLTKVTLTVGITTSQFNKAKELAELIEPWDLRAQNVTSFLATCLPCLIVRCEPLDDIFGPALEPQQNLLVVTQETEANAELVQKRREELGLRRTSVYSVPLLEGSGDKISSSQHRREIIGKLVKPPKLRDLRSYVVGLTGPTCAGKSTAARLLRRLGAQVLDCDRLAQETYRPGTDLYKALIDRFGVQILDVKTSADHRAPPIDRRVLGAIVFGNKEKMALLCQMVWPKLKERIKDELRRSESKVIVMDAAVLIQAGFLEFVDEVWVCLVDQATCIQRLMSSRRLLYSEAVKRLEAQLADEDYVREANILISTRGTEEETAEIVKNCWSELMARLQKRKRLDWLTTEGVEPSNFDADSVGQDGDDEGGDTTEDDNGK